MRRRVRFTLIALLAAGAAVLCWAGLTEPRRLPGLCFLTLACVLWVPMALLVPVRPDPDE
jgi:hypothetical protein